NDTHGHPVGDVVLREVAQTIQLTLRPYDAVGRYGGEEFLMVHPAISPGAQAHIAERVRQAVADHKIQVGSEFVSVTISIGTALLPAGTHMPPEVGLKMADEALYRAKNAGRNCVAAAESDSPR
ncbi:MAG: GGDEF domain-containing protein, partial [Myxococcales bacterium]|nr:GGDEF domain-containing protein [Myxococcales bacterium]